ncbi:MAG: P-II family nitrogen regulator [Clostridium sp.]|jgi:nitrogen regulatory protein PII|nr:P-II family nitrogen regulator [Clostridium sp.]
MQNNAEIELLCVIVNFGLGSKVMKFSKQMGMPGGTIFLGRGTVNNRILEFFDLSDIRKEIVLMLGKKTTTYNALEELNKKFRFDKPNHGIAFSTSVMNILGTKSIESNDINKEKRGAEKTMYNAIYVVVDKGKAESVIDAAKEAGARGGTIINARGSGIHETSKLFSMDIEPEKEIVLILADDQITSPITSSVREKLQIDQPGNGIIFVQSVNKTYGLR